MQSTCRFYKNRLPQADEFVLVKVTDIGEFGVHVELLEYNHHPGRIHLVLRSISMTVRLGMIPLAELSNSRIRSVLKLISVGGEEVATVLRVNDGRDSSVKRQEKNLIVASVSLGYIDLSKRRVSSEDVQRCHEKLARGKTVRS